MTAGDDAPRDARFADAADRPARLAAETVEDLKIIAAMAQDAVGKLGETHWMRGRRRFALLLNRFRWEDATAAERARRPYERVRSALEFENVETVRGRGVDPSAKEGVYAILDLAFDAEEDGAGVVRVVLAGGGEIAVRVEALDARLTDLTRPWEARRAPDHDDDG